MSGSGQTETGKNMQRRKVLERPETIGKQKIQKAAEIGIENMKERVRMLGGTMQIQKETGFRIFITVPKNEGKR